MPTIYMQAIKDLQQTLTKIEPGQVQPIQALIAKVEELHRQLALPTNELTAIIDATQKLLTGYIEKKEYQEKCKLLRTSKLPIYSALSDLMLAVAANLNSRSTVDIKTQDARQPDDDNPLEIPPSYNT